MEDPERLVTSEDNIEFEILGDVTVSETETKSIHWDDVNRGMLLGLIGDLDRETSFRRAIDALDVNDEQLPLYKRSIFKRIIGKLVTHNDVYKDDYDGLVEYRSLTSLLNSWIDLKRSKDIIAKAQLASLLRPFTINRADTTSTIEYLDKDQSCYIDSGTENGVKMIRCFGMPDPDEVVYDGFLIVKEEDRLLRNIVAETIDVTELLQKLQKVSTGDSFPLRYTDKETCKILQVENDEIEFETTNGFKDKIDRSQLPYLAKIENNDSFDPNDVFDKTMMVSCGTVKDRELLGRMLNPSIAACLHVILKYLNESDVTDLNTAFAAIRKMQLNPETMTKMQYQTLVTTIESKVSAIEKQLKIVRNLDDKPLPKPSFELTFVENFNEEMEIIRQASVQAAALRPVQVSNTTQKGGASESSKPSPDAQETNQMTTSTIHSVYDLYHRQHESLEPVEIETYLGKRRYDYDKGVWKQRPTGVEFPDVKSAVVQLRENTAKDSAKAVSQSTELETETLRSIPRKIIKITDLEVFKPPEIQETDYNAFMEDIHEDDLLHMDNPAFYKIMMDKKTESSLSTNEQSVKKSLLLTGVFATEEGELFLLNNCDFYNNPDLLKTTLVDDMQKALLTLKTAEQRATSEHARKIISDRFKIKLQERQTKIQQDFESRSTLISLSMLAIMVTLMDPLYIKNMDRVDPDCINIQNKSLSPLDMSVSYVVCKGKVELGPDTEDTIKNYVKVILKDKEHLEQKLKEVQQIPKWMKQTKQVLVNSKDPKIVSKNTDNITNEPLVPRLQLQEQRELGEQSNQPTNEIVTGNDIVKLDKKDVDSSKVVDIPKILSCGQSEEALIHEAANVMNQASRWFVEEGMTNTKMIPELLNKMDGRMLQRLWNGTLGTALSRLVFEDPNKLSSTKIVYGVATNTQKLLDVEDILTKTLVFVQANAKDDIDALKTTIKQLLSDLSNQDSVQWIAQQEQQHGANGLKTAYMIIIGRALSVLLGWSASMKDKELCKYISSDTYDNVCKPLLEYFAKQILMHSQTTNVDMDILQKSKIEAREIRDADVTKKMDVMSNELRSSVTKLKQAGYAQWRELVNELNLDLEIEEQNEDTEPVESTLDDNEENQNLKTTKNEEDEGYDMMDADKDIDDEEYERDENERD
jgi:hypothetical protein